MAQNSGTLIIAPIRPNDSLDQIASVYANETMGGHHGYATLSERNSLIAARRNWGMLVTVYNDGTPSNNNTYQLVYNLNSTTITDNNNWQVYNASITTGSGLTYSNNTISVYGLTTGNLSASNGPTNGYVLTATANGVFNWVPPQVNLSNVVRLTALGTNSNYYATFSTPNIATYSTNNIYLVDFLYTNNTNVVSLNINNIGTVSIFKYDISGTASIDVYNLKGATGSIAGPIYSLSYNGNYFQLISDPLNSYTNTNYTATAIGGVPPISAFNGLTLKSVLNELIYPESQTKITFFGVYGPTSGFSTQSNIRVNDVQEVGYYVYPGTFSFMWTVSTASGYITASNLYSNRLFDNNKGDYGVGGINNGLVWTASVVRGATYGGYGFPLVQTFAYTNMIRNDGLVTYVPATIEWRYRYYFGSSTYSGITNSLPNLYNNNLLLVNPFGNYNVPYDGTIGTYKWFILPSKDGATISNFLYRGMSVPMADETDGFTYSDNGINYTLRGILNTYGLTVSYKCYRSKNIINATLSSVTIQ